MTIDWTLAIKGPNGGANIQNNVPFKSCRMSWTSDGPGAIELAIPESVMLGFGSDWTAGLHRLVMKRNGDPKWSGYNTNVTRSGPPGDREYTVSGLGLSSVLDYRLIRDQFNMTDEVSNIMFQILDDIQAQINGDMGFSHGAVHGTTVTRTRGYCLGVVVGDAYREMAAIDRGCDWEINADGQLEIWNGTRGTNTGLDLYEEDVQNFEVESDTSDLLTTVSVLGQKNDPFGPRHIGLAAGYADNYGRREAVVEVDAENDDDGEMTDAGTAELEVRGGARLRVTASWLEGHDPFPWGWGAVWLQDKVTVHLDDFFAGNQNMRCIDITTTLEPGAQQNGDDLVFHEYTFESLVTDITAE